MVQREAEVRVYFPDVRIAVRLHVEYVGTFQGGR